MITDAIIAKFITTMQGLMSFFPTPSFAHTFNVHMEYVRDRLCYYNWIIPLEEVLWCIKISFGLFAAILVVKFVMYIWQTLPGKFS